MRHRRHHDHISDGQLFLAIIAALAATGLFCCYILPVLVWTSNHLWKACLK